MSRPAISVIVPVYNAKAWLCACVESILAQSFADFELLLVDDGSTDGSRELCCQLAQKDARIRVICQPNQGPSVARNHGIEQAQGQYLSFVDSDDILCGEFLQTLYQACQQHQADMAMCAVEDVREDGTSNAPPRCTLPAATGVFCGQDLLECLFGSHGPCYSVVWNKLYRATVWQHLRFTPGKSHGEDNLISHRMLAQCQRVVCLDEVLYRYRVRSGSLCHSGLTPQAFQQVEAEIDRYRFFKEQFPHRSQLIETAYAMCWKQFLCFCAQARQAPTPALQQAMAQQQRNLRPLLGHLPASSQLDFWQKCSAVRWCLTPVGLLCSVTHSQQEETP